jgi:hypothetical protein
VPLLKAAISALLSSPLRSLSTLTKIGADMRPTTRAASLPRAGGWRLEGLATLEKVQASKLRASLRPRANRLCIRTV